MKITIEPSLPEPNYHAASVNTLTNEDSTGEIVYAAFQAIVASGHHPRNVLEAFRDVADEQESVRPKYNEDRDDR